MTHQILDALLPLAVPIETLHPDPANARTHSRRNLDTVKASLARFGQRAPLVVQKQGMVVRAGNARLVAMKELGWTQAAALVVDENDIQATAYAITDNRSSELGEWDEDVLAELFATLQKEPDFDGALVGFSDREIRALLGPTPGLCDADEVPEVPAEPTTKPGDLYLLGGEDGHRLICGDATDPAVVARVLRDDKPRLLTVDPPFGVELDQEWRDRAGLNALGPAEPSYLRERAEGFKNTTISGDTIADWSPAFELVPSLDTAYVWHASAFAVEVALGLRRIGFEIKQQLIWKKTHFALSRQFYHWGHEPCWLARKKNALPFRGSRDQGTVWEHASPKMLMSGSQEERFDHPCQKPVALFTRPIENHLERGECLYDCFCGSGTAMTAAEQTGTRCLAIELDPKYCDVIVARFEKFSGKPVERVRA